MKAAVLKSALKLSKAERILLVEDIWDSIAAEPDGVELSTAQKVELTKRLDRLKRTGPQGSDWATVKRPMLKERP